MLEDLLKFDKLGTKEEIHFILFHALPLSETQKIEDIKKYCCSNVFTISKSFSGIIKLLESLSFLNIEKQRIVVNLKKSSPITPRASEETFIEEIFIPAILKFFKKENFAEIIFNPNAIKFAEIDNRFYIKENLIPCNTFPIRNLLLSFKFFERDDSFPNHLLINTIFNKSFQSIILDDLQTKRSKSVKRKMSIEQLKKQLELKEKLGLEAELFVESLEKKRLEGHILINKVRRISDNFVNAGYDIESFNNKESVFIDRLIEVKSFRGEVSFYWSNEELQIAKEEGDNYFLYLVDRDKVNDSDYSPSVFQNPYNKVFENEWWKKETAKWKITLE